MREYAESHLTREFFKTGESSFGNMPPGLGDEESAGGFENAKHVAQETPGIGQFVNDREGERKIDFAVQIVDAETFSR